MTVEVRTGGAGLVGEWFEAVCGLYAEVFTKPPFLWTERTAPTQRRELAGLMRDPSFGIAVACDGAVLVGSCYGVRLPVDHLWWTGFRQPLPDEFVREWEGRSFGLVDLAVAERYRGRGLGRALIAALLGTRGEQRAVLSVQPSVADTQDFYRHLGWRHLGRKGPLEFVVPAYWDIYVRDL